MLLGLSFIWALLLCSAQALSLTNVAAEQEERKLALAQHLSFLGVRRMLRDEHAPAHYKAELRYQHKRETQPREKREAAAASLLNLTRQGLSVYDSQQNYQGQFELVNRLDLSHNRLSSLQLQNFTQLQQLHACNNTLTVLPAVSGTLITLDLSGNQLSQLSGSFFEQRMPQLKQLNLAHNRLGGAIARQAFYNLIGLETLLLSWNNITDIDYETFLALPNLQHLDLSHNQLSGSAIRALQGIPDLVSLSIAYNPQVGAAMQEFVASWSLKELDASGTGLCQVPAALAQSVRTLKLSHNWLQSINCGDLDSYPLLQYLDLSYSHVAQLEDDALGRLELLELLFLDHNSLMRVPNSLPTSLEHLFLQHNSIMELQPQAFVGLKNLKTLDLSGNRLMFLPALPLPQLLTLNLQSSGIESVSQSIVHTLPQLRDLLLEDNPVRCSDLLGIAEWASPCRSVDLGRTLGRIDLKRRYVQLGNFYDSFSPTCGGVANELDTADEEAVQQAKSMPPTCGITATTAATTATTMPATMPKVQKSKAAAATQTNAMQSSGNNIALLTTKTLGPAETTSLAQLQRQQMPGMPTEIITTTAAATATTIATAAAVGVPSLQHAAKRTSILASSSPTPPATTTTITTAPTRLAKPTNISNVAAVAATQLDVPQTILALISSDVASKQKLAKSVLKQTATTESTAATTVAAEMPSDTAGQEPQPIHKHATLQLHIKDRHLIGTPLLMHKGDNLLIDAEQLLLPGTATVADAETLAASQRQEATDKRQAEAIKGDTKASARADPEHAKLKKKPSLSIKKMTYSTKHAAATIKTTAAATETTATVTQSTRPQHQHQHSSVNTPNEFKQELSTFAQLKAFVELKTEASKSAQLLATRLSPQQTLNGSHPGLMLLLACILVIVLLAGLAHVYRCELPWQRGPRAGHQRPHHQRQLNENDDVHSFLHYQGSGQADPARLGAWHHSTRREAPYSSPLHNLQARELQREQQKLQFYSASLADSSIGSGSGSGCSSGSSRSSLHSPSNEDSYYIEMAPSSPMTAASDMSHLPMELLGSSNSNSSGAHTDPAAATHLGNGLTPTASTLRSMSSKLMAPSTRRLGIW
ncbi:uncharacterized protein LOC111594628 [Drosophila hydei]|uniref:Uncharacterized protein LOC111594628 n=1 Tax=Drosophila hydei TaxID=7224 RepID=A0A6J1LAK4_DROHY|nr:uncharacterized protein LOC111594628 [Drosophila hydei]